MISKANRLSQIQEYYFSKKLREVQELINQGNKIINLGIGNPDLPPSKNTIQKLCQTAIKSQNHGYQPYRGITELRRAMADWYKRIYNVNLDADSQVLPLIGSKEGVFHISMAFLNPGEQVLVPDPGYATYPSTARLAGAEPVYYDLTEENGWLPDLQILRKTATSNIKLMWINYPHMPSGAVASQELFHELIDFALEKKILVCHDNPYSLILNKNAPLSIFRIPDAFDCCLELNSMSKSHNMAGWRVGMVVGSHAYVNPVLTLKSNVDSGMFLPIQLAAVQAFKNPKKWHQAQNQLYQQRRNLVFKLLDALNFTYSTDIAGLFVWAKAPVEIENLETFLDELLHKKGIFITPGKIFGKNGERYIRISICASEEKIQRAIQLVQS